MSLENIIWASRQGATVTCEKCMQPGHNARTHKNCNTPRFIQSQQVPHSSTVSIPGSSSSNSRGRSFGKGKFKSEDKRNISLCTSKSVRREMTAASEVIHV